MYILDAAKAKQDAQDAEKTKQDALADAAKAKQDAQDAEKTKQSTQADIDKILQEALDEPGPEGVPLWVTNLSSLDAVLAAAKEKGVFVGIGSATNSKAYQAIQMAEARARQDIAFQREALIKAEITDYAKNMEGVKGDIKSLSNAAEDYIIGQQSVETRLPSAKVVKRQKEPKSNTWWVIVTTAIQGTGDDLKNAEVTTFPYEVKEAPKAVEEMEQHLLDQRQGRNKLKPTVSLVVNREPASEVTTEAVIE